MEFDEDMLYVVILILVPIVVLVLIFLGAVALSGSLESYRCNVLAKEGIDVKIVNDFLPFDKICMVNVTGKYIPYNRWIESKSTIVK